MWSNILKTKPKKPGINFEITGPTAVEVGDQQYAERAALCAEHVKRLKPLNERLSKLPHTTHGNIESQLKQQIQEEKERYKAAREELAASHRRVNEGRARKASEMITRTVVPIFLEFVKTHDVEQVDWLIEVHPKLKEATRHIVIGPGMHGGAYALRMAEALLLEKDRRVLLNEFAHGIPDVGQSALWEALESRNVQQAIDAMLRMEFALLRINHGRAPLENATYVWARRLTCDFMDL